MRATLQDLSHPALRPGGEWMLVVMLVTVIALLFGGAVLAVRALAENPPELVLPVPASPSAS